MLTLKNAVKSGKIDAVETQTTLATIPSDRVGYEYIIFSKASSGYQILKFTKEQMKSIFNDGVPSEMIQWLPRKQMIAEHEYRIQHDAPYREYFQSKLDKAIEAYEANKPKSKSKKPKAKPDEAPKAEAPKAEEAPQPEAPKEDPVKQEQAKEVKAEDKPKEDK